MPQRSSSTETAFEHSDQLFPKTRHYHIQNDCARLVAMTPFSNVVNLACVSQVSTQSENRVIDLELFVFQ